MSGDVQPRKRKDKKKKKDDLGIEEPRGTAATLGEGDIFMHSQNEHGTGGHWCAKIIFFSLLAVLITLIGLIILENRGLTELEANSVESRYSGVLEGWLEDAGDDDHHDEHTLELKHHDDEDEDDDHGGELDRDIEHDDDDEDEDHDHDDNEEEHDHDDDENEDGEHDHNDGEDDDQTQEDEEVEQEEDDQGINENSDEDNEADDDNDGSEDRNIETAEDDEDEVEERSYRKFYQSNENQGDNDDEDDDDDDDDYNIYKDVENNSQEDNDVNDDHQNDEDDTQKDDDDDHDNEEQNQFDDDGDGEENFNENDEDEAQDNEDEEDHEELEGDSIEVEHIEQEVFDEDVSSEPEPAPASRQSREDHKSQEVSKEAPRVDQTIDDDVEMLEPDEFDDDLPELLPIPSSKAKPLVEVEDSPSTERPQDTLAEEEEYERQQEELRREKEQASQGMWLKLLVGGALLVATQAVLRRATAPRAEPDDEVDTTREETPLSDRRMTLIPGTLPPPIVISEIVQESPKPVIKEGPKVSKPPAQELDEDVVEEEEEEQNVIIPQEPAAAVDRELYSDEEEVEHEEDEIEPPKPVPTKAIPVKEIPKPIATVKEIPKLPDKKDIPVIEKEPTSEDEKYEDDDVEIIEDEELGEELEDEEISDVDDAELLNRLEAKYGRLSEPERPGRQSKHECLRVFTKHAPCLLNINKLMPTLTECDGGNSIEDQWPGEPSDSFWRDELDQAEQDLRQGEWTRAMERASASRLRSSGRARYIAARALDMSAEAKRDNGLLTKAIAAYLELLKMNERLSDMKLKQVTDRAIDRIMFRGNYMGAEPVYRLLIRRFPDVVGYRNNLTISFLMANRVDLAEEVLKETLSRWPNDRVALAHHGFILKTRHNKFEEAVEAFKKALEGDKGPANEARFYYHLGDSLLLLGRPEEALEVHKRGAKLGHFLSPLQRSLYNVDRLKSKPWWNVEDTPYVKLARTLEQSWKEILKEGLAAQELYEKEKEGLMERGEWSQMDIFVRGREVSGRCSRAPVTCGAVRAEAGARGCRRGQVKFSAMRAGTHVRPHVGPTNCRLRMHLGLHNTDRTYIRVGGEIRQWQTGKVLMFDDSFEHEVWHNGTGTRLVLIVDVWHPDLTAEEKRQLPAI